MKSLGAGSMLCMMLTLALASGFAGGQGVSPDEQKDYLASGTDRELARLLKKVQGEIQAASLEPDAQKNIQKDPWAHIRAYRQRPRSQEDLTVLHAAAQRALQMTPVDWYSVDTALQIASHWPADPEMAKFARQVITPEKPRLITVDIADTLVDALWILSQQGDAESMEFLGECVRGNTFGAKPPTHESASVTDGQMRARLQKSAAACLSDVQSPELAIPVLERLQAEFPPIADASLSAIEIAKSPDLRIRQSVECALEKQRLRSQGLSDKEIFDRLVGGYITE